MKEHALNHPYIVCGVLLNQAISAYLGSQTDGEKAQVVLHASEVKAGLRQELQVRAHQIKHANISLSLVYDIWVYEHRFPSPKPRVPRTWQEDLI